MKMYLAILSTSFLLAASYSLASEETPKDCPCVNCKCTSESNCGCFSGNGCQCKECSYDCDCSRLKEDSLSKQ